MEEHMRFCTNCGKQVVNDSAKFCPECGADLKLQGKSAEEKKSLFKKSTTWILIAVIAVAAVLLFFELQKANNDQSAQTIETESIVADTKENKSNETITDVSEKKDSNDRNNISFTGSSFTGDESIEILADYTYYYSIGTIEHIIVVKNKSDKVIDVGAESLVYDIEGKLLGVVSTNNGNGIDALSPGEISMVHEYGNEVKSDSVGYYETKIMTADSKYKPIIEDLSYSSAEVEKGYVFSVTNNTENSAKYVVGYALFFNNGELVEFDRPYFEDEDYELKPGDTIHKQSSCNKEFDSVEFYITGRQK